MCFVDDSLCWMPHQIHCCSSCDTPSIKQHSIDLLLCNSNRSVDCCHIVSQVLPVAVSVEVSQSWNVSRLIDARFEVLNSLLSVNSSLSSCNTSSGACHVSVLITCGLIGANASQLATIRVVVRDSGLNLTSVGSSWLLVARSFISLQCRLYQRQHLESAQCECSRSPLSDHVAKTSNFRCNECSLRTCA